MQVPHRRQSFPPSRTLQSCSLTSPSHCRTALTPPPRKGRVYQKEACFPQAALSTRSQPAAHPRKPLFGQLFRPALTASKNRHTTAPTPSCGRPAGGAEPRPAGRAPSAALAPGLPRMSTAAMAAPRTAERGGACAGSGRGVGGAGAVPCRAVPCEGRAALVPKRGGWPEERLPEARGYAATASQHK